jgi:ATP/maltotriose-dependent transcriptional regulator MalT
MTGQARGAGETDTKTPVLPAPAMVGRVELLEEINGLLATACAGRGRGVVIQAEAGMGKTTVAETLADRAAHSGVNTVWGRCSAAEVPPFWPWREILISLAPGDPLAVDGEAVLPRPGLL